MEKRNANNLSILLYVNCVLGGSDAKSTLDIKLEFQRNRFLLVKRSRVSECMRFQVV